MKKYTKPMIVFESFTLSTNIAGDCEVKATGPTGNFHVAGCGIIWNTTNWEGTPVVEQLFTTSWNGCDSYPPEADDGEYNSYCYDVPIETNNVFNS